MKWNQKAWVLGGKQNGSISRQVWKSSLPNLEEWSQGPELKEARSHQGCGVISNHGLLFVFGAKGSNTTEVLTSRGTSFEYGKFLNLIC